MVADWTTRSQPVRIGDTVGYSRRFLQSIACYTGDMPRARGTVTALVPVGTDVTLAEITWNTPGLPGRINVKNLSTVKQIAHGE